ncbi:MAG: hypothetical protein WBV92_05255 [Nitrosotalea sp.]
MNNRRGISTVVGAVFFIIIFTTAVTFVNYDMNLLNNFTGAFVTKSQAQADANHETFSITQVTIANNKFNITVQNSGSIPITIDRLWVENKTDITWGTSKYAVNQIVYPGNSLSQIGQSLPLYAKPTQGYDLKLVTMRGNVKEFFVNSASQAPVYLQLFALPSTGSNNFIATLLLGVTNNMTNGGALTNIVPNMVVSNVTGVGKATLISGPTPSSYPILNNGAETFFQWNYNINGSNGYTANFQASLQNGYLYNTVSQNVVLGSTTTGIVEAYSTYSASHTLLYTEDTVNFNTTSATTIVTLPNSVGHTGKTFTIRDGSVSAGNMVRILTTASQTIDGYYSPSGSMNLTHQDQLVKVISDGSNWKTIGFDPSEPVDYFMRGSTTAWYGNAIHPTNSSILISTPSTLRTTPWVVPHTLTINEIQAEISTAANPTTTTCHIGIYRDNGNVYPQTLVTGSDVGTFTTTASVKTLTFGTPITLTKGLYWEAWTCGTAATTQPTFRANTVDAIPPVLGYVNTMGAKGFGTAYTVSYTYGSLPVTYPSGATILASIPTPMILVEIQKG